MRAGRSAGGSARGSAGGWTVRGRSVLVTGASRGIGAATASGLAARGARVSLVGLEAERLQALAAQLPGAAWFEADVRDPAALRAAVVGTVERFGGLDVVVANAGVAGIGTVADIEVESFERTIEVNLLGVWRTVRATLEQLEQRGGYVLIVSSVAAAAHLPLMAPYAASKAGVAAFANALRLEQAGNGVDVGVAYFSFIDTDMVRTAFADPLAAPLLAALPAGLVKPLALPAASKALITAIERRSRRVIRPRAMAPLIAAPGLFRPLLDRGVRRMMRAR